jgi:hypothetical protein
LPESLGDADSFAGNKQKQRLENSPKSLSKSPAAHDEFSAYLNPPFPFRTQWSDSMSQSLVIRVGGSYQARWIHDPFHRITLAKMETVHLASLFQDFQNKPFFELHTGSAKKRSDASGRPSLFSDDLSKVARRNSEFQNSSMLSLNFRHRDLCGVIHKRFRNHIY